jgi:hypothetical protein
MPGWHDFLSSFGPCLLLLYAVVELFFVCFSGSCCDMFYFERHARHWNNLDLSYSFPFLLSSFFFLSLSLSLTHLHGLHSNTGTIVRPHVTNGDTLFVLGGRTQSSILSDFWSYDKNQQWVQLSTNTASSKVCLTVAVGTCQVLLHCCVEVMRVRMYDSCHCRCARARVCVCVCVRVCVCVSHTRWSMHRFVAGSSH